MVAFKFPKEAHNVPKDTHNVQHWSFQHKHYIYQFGSEKLDVEELGNFKVKWHLGGDLKDIKCMISTMIDQL